MDSLIFQKVLVEFSKGEGSTTIDRLHREGAQKGIGEQ